MADFINNNGVTDYDRNLGTPPSDLDEQVIVNNILGISRTADSVSDFSNRASQEVIRFNRSQAEQKNFINGEREFSLNNIAGAQQVLSESQAAGSVAVLSALDIASRNVVNRFEEERVQRQEAQDQQDRDFLIQERNIKSQEDNDLKNSLLGKTIQELRRDAIAEGITDFASLDEQGLADAIVTKKREEEDAIFKKQREIENSLLGKSIQELRQEAFDASVPNFESLDEKGLIDAISKKRASSEVIDYTKIFSNLGLQDNFGTGNGSVYDITTGQGEGVFTPNDLGEGNDPRQDFLKNYSSSNNAVQNSLNNARNELGFGGVPGLTGLGFTADSGKTFTQSSFEESGLGGNSFLGSLGQITAYGSPLWSAGLDVDLAKGDPVTAPFSGKVVFAGESKGFGKQIRIQDSSGREIWLSHFDDIDVNEGDTVTAGQFIGKGGNSGSTIPGPNGDGSHLDITVVNPDRSYQTPQEVEQLLRNYA